MELRKVLSYYFKNILYMLLFAVAPALFLGFLVHPFSIIEMLYNYPNMTSFSFADFFVGVYSSGAWGILWFVLGFVLVILCTCLLIGKIELHFRTGKFDLSNHSVRSINNNLSSVSLVALLLIVLNFLLNVIALLLMFFVHFVAGGDGGATVASITINWIIGITFVLAEGCFTVVFMFTAIDMAINGSPFTVALSDAFNNWSRHNCCGTILTAVFPFVVGIVLTVLGAWLGVTWLTNILSILFLLPYVCILGMIDFFTYFDIPRYDNRTYYNLN